MDGKRDREPFAFDGRSLEEQLASLDALSGERWEPPHDEAGPDEGDSRPDEAAGEGQSRPEPPEPAAADPPGPAPSILSTMGPYAQERPPAFEAPRDPEAGSEQESWPQEGLDDVSADGSAEVPFGMPGERPSFFGQPFAVQTNDEPTAQFTGVSPAPEGEPAGEASLRPADDAQEGPARDPAPAVVAGDGDDAGGDRDTGAHAFSPETSPFFHSAPALSGEPPFVGESRSYENGQEPRETQEPERAAQGGAFDSDQSQSPQRGYAEEPPEAQQYPSRSPAPQGYGTGPFQRDPNAPPRGRAEPPPYPPSHTPDPQPYAGDPHEEQASPTYSDPPYAYPPAEVPFTGAPLYEAGPWPEIHPTEPPLFPGGPFRSSADGQAPQPPDQASSPYGSAPTYGQPAPQPETSDSLSPETLLRGRRRAPSHGWRRAVYRASGGLVRPGESPAELRHRQLVARARTPVAGGHHRVAVLSLKGGVGKTTTTVALGSCLASLRGDRAIAVDANPDRGTLSDKVRLETAATVRDLLNERSEVHRYADVRAFTSQAPSRLEVLASDRDPAVSEAFSEADYQAVAQVLEHFYSICLTDCGTGLLHSAMSGVLRLANQIVVVSSPSVDGARSASATLDWLEAHEYGDLVRTATVVLSAVRENSKSSVDLDRLEQHFASRSNAVIRVPYDPHLEEGAEVDLERLKSGTRDAYLTLAATVGDGFGRRR